MQVNEMEVLKLEWCGLWLMMAKKNSKTLTKLANYSGLLNFFMVKILEMIR